MVISLRPKENCRGNDTVARQGCAAGSVTVSPLAFCSVGGVVQRTSLPTGRRSENIGVWSDGIKRMDSHRLVSDWPTWHVSDVIPS